MTTVPLSDRPEAPLFCDGLGDRVVAADGATGELLQILRIRPALTAVPSFEFALRERAARLANFRHAYYGRVRRIDRVAVPGPGLSIVSDHVEGTRLSDILRVAHERNLELDINTALCLIRQLVPAVALLHENAREVAHGLLAPERLIVTPHARLVIVEHVLAAAVEQLQFGRDRLWQDFRIAMPPSAGLARFDHRADVTAIGLVALALVLGRPIETHEFPAQIPTLLNEARERSALGEEQPLSAPLRDWLSRALQVDPRRAFAAAPEALSSARGNRRGRFDVRRRARCARDIHVPVHRGAARAARRADARARAVRFHAASERCESHQSLHAGRRNDAAGNSGGQQTGRVCAPAAAFTACAGRGELCALRCAATGLRAGRACVSHARHLGQRDNSGGLRFRGARDHRPDPLRRSEGDP